MWRGRPSNHHYSRSKPFFVIQIQFLMCSNQIRIWRMWSGFGRRYCSLLWMDLINHVIIAAYRKWIHSIITRGARMRVNGFCVRAVFANVRVCLCPGFACARFMCLYVLRVCTVIVCVRFLRARFMRVHGSCACTFIACVLFLRVFYFCVCTVFVCEKFCVCTVFLCVLFSCVFGFLCVYCFCVWTDFVCVLFLCVYMQGRFIRGLGEWKEAEKSIAGCDRIWPRKKAIPEEEEEEKRESRHGCLSQGSEKGEEPPTFFFHLYLGGIADILDVRSEGNEQN